MSLLIKGGHLIDPGQGIDKPCDLLIEDGCIKTVAYEIAPESGQQVLNARGLIVAPGFIDMHVHLREPGREDKETIATGTRAAVAGGFTSVCPMPNSSPVNDNQAVTEYILSIARKTAVCNVLPIGAVSTGQQGKKLADMGELKGAGVVALSDDGHPVMQAEMMRRALEYASMFDLLLISHCEERSLAGAGYMREGVVSTALGMPAIPAEAESLMVARDIILAEMTNGRVHMAHISTAQSVALIREAQLRGVKVTAEVTPHHFSLTHEAVRSFDTATKVNPPLGTQADLAAIKVGLQDGTLSVIATDHAPHTLAEKELEYSSAPFGMVGLETALGLIATKLVKPGILSWSEALAKLTINPAELLGIERGLLLPGSVADITLFDPDETFTVTSSNFFSKGRNTPFEGWELQGVVQYTIVGGSLVFQKGKLC